MRFETIATEGGANLPSTSKKHDYELSDNHQISEELAYASSLEQPKTKNLTYSDTKFKPSLHDRQNP